MVGGLRRQLSGKLKLADCYWTMSFMWVLSPLSLRTETDPSNNNTQATTLEDDLIECLGRHSSWIAFVRCPHELEGIQLMKLCSIHTSLQKLLTHQGRDNRIYLGCPFFKNADAKLQSYES